MSALLAAQCFNVIQTRIQSCATISQAKKLCPKVSRFLYDLTVCSPSIHTQVQNPQTNDPMLLNQDFNEQNDIHVTAPPAHPSSRALKHHAVPHAPSTAPPVILNPFAHIVQSTVILPSPSPFGSTASKTLGLTSISSSAQPWQVSTISAWAVLPVAGFVMVI